MESTLQSNLNDLITFRNSQDQFVHGTLLKLTRTSLVFEVYNPYSIVQLSEVLSDVTISRGDRAIYEGRAVVSNLVNTGLMLIVSTTLVDPWTELVDLKPGPILQKEVKNFIDEWDSNHQRLEPNYKLIVTKIRNFLQEFNLWLEQIELSSGINETDIPDETIDNFTQDIESASSPNLDKLFDEFNSEAESIPEDDVVTHKMFARHELHPLTLCSPFMHRTFSKPLGYAGDYEMVNMILNNKGQGTNTYAKVVDSFSLRTKTAQAHRNRIQILLKYLEQEAERVATEHKSLRILNIGCGPAFEIQQFIKNSSLSNNTDFELIDFNKETIDYASERINKIIKEQHRETKIKYTQKSIHTLLKQSASSKNTVPEEQYDLIYCAGLFDYISDKICKRLVNLFYKQLVPGGVVVVTNVSKKHPVKGFMEHLQEWYLILRDETNLSEFVPANSQFVIMADETEINIFLEARKPIE
jgi:extracellular factor (EF) 3-hydroxypalmitic acid methyl ester biosynthesis protein